jgi:branched-chain amino acid aminotransferase
MNECSQYKYLHNSKLRDTHKFKNEFFRNGLSLYEVIRVVNSKAVFLKQHLTRLESSAKKVGQFVWLNYNELVEKIELVIASNGVVEGNIKIVFNIHENDRNFYCYFVHHKYPTKQEYQEGISTIVYNAERSNPNAKVYNHKLRTYTNTVIESPDVFEVLLMDNLGNITEGSRSNLFFIKDNMLVTAPDNQVLNGIVRAKIIEICERVGVPILKETIAYSSLSQYDSAFLTGTSPQILPIRHINALSFDVNHHLLKLLLKSYRNELADYIQKQS